MLTYRVTYFPDGTRLTTFFGSHPTDRNRRVTLTIPPPVSWSQASNKLLSTNSSSRRNGKAVGGHEESQTLPSLTSVPARNRRRTNPSVSRTSRESK